VRILKSKLKNIIQEELRILLNEQQYVNVPNNLVYNPDKEKTFTGKKGFKHTLVGKGNVWRVTLPGKKAKWMTSGQFAYWFAKATQRVGAVGKLPTGVKIERKYRSGDPADYAGKPIEGVPRTMGMFQQDVTDQFKLELGPEDIEAHAEKKRRDAALRAELEKQRSKFNEPEDSATDDEGAALTFSEDEATAALAGTGAPKTLAGAPFKYNKFYHELDKRGMAHLLKYPGHSTGKDYKFGKSHRKALEALNKRMDLESSDPAAKIASSATPDVDASIAQFTDPEAAASMGFPGEDLLQEVILEEFKKLLQS